MPLWLNIALKENKHFQKFYFLFTNIFFVILEINSNGPYNLKNCRISLGIFERRMM